MRKFSPINRLSRLPIYLMRHTIAMSLAVFVLLSALSVSAWLLIPESGSEALEDDTRNNLEHFSAQLEAHILTRLTIAEHIRRQMVRGHIDGKIQFLSEAHSTIELFKDFQAINWADPNGIIRWVYPFEENKAAVGLNVRALPTPKRILEKAEISGKMEVTPPITLQQGGKGFVAYIPITKAHKSAGFLDIVFRIKPLIHKAIEMEYLDLYTIRITDGNHMVYQNRPIDANSGLSPLTQDIKVGDRVWTIAMAPSAANIAAHKSIIDELVLAALLLLTAAISYLVYLTMQHQQKLHASDVLFRTFIEYSPSAINIKDVDGHYLHVNSRWHSWFNPEGKDFLGKDMSEFFTPEQTEEVRKQEKYIIETKQPIKKEYQLELADGRKVTTQLYKVPILNKLGEVIAIGGMNTDITDSKKTEEMLRLALMKAEEASQSKSKFLATMSHELRTPLNAIIGFSDILIGQYFGALGNEKYVEYVTDINHSGKHLLSLIDEVLDISAIELGKRKLVKEPIAIGSLLNDCLKTVSHRAEQRGIALNMDVPGDLPEITADQTATRQIFLNLLANAIKFTHPGDQITVTARPFHKRVLITVADTGVGIRKDQLDRITEPFVKGDSDSLVTNEGVGLGLSIVKSFVTAQNGTLSIQSELGIGTTVTVTLPTQQDDNRLVA